MYTIYDISLHNIKITAILPFEKSEYSICRNVFLSYHKKNADYKFILSIQKKLINYMTKTVVFYV